MRKLTPNQIRKVKDFVEKLERAKSPGYTISVSVKKLTSDRGNPVVSISRMSEAEIQDFEL